MFDSKIKRSDVRAFELWIAGIEHAAWINRIDGTAIVIASVDVSEAPQWCARALERARAMGAAFVRFC